MFKYHVSAPESLLTKCRGQLSNSLNNSLCLSLLRISEITFSIHLSSLWSLTYSGLSSSWFFNKTHLRFEVVKRLKILQWDSLQMSAEKYVSTGLLSIIGSKTNTFLQLLTSRVFCWKIFWNRNLISWEWDGDEWLFRNIFFLAKWPEFFWVTSHKHLFLIWNIW